MPPFANHKKPISQTVSDFVFSPSLPACLSFISGRFLSFSPFTFPLYFPFPATFVLLVRIPKYPHPGKDQLLYLFFKFFWFVFWNQLQRKVKKKTDGQRPGVVS
ncbi:hypothetical protein F5Y07DRAFT_157976 [Xylaria sp. FL0933]|nr:hypothetical protein F5Y07DRAFT_157976 [Xylaria sp. FL0933]